MRKKFTGRHMLAVLVGGFALVIAVNFYMAWRATHGFGGVVVENSYVASQNFNHWLDSAKRGRALGWNADVVRDASGHLSIDAQGVPAGAGVRAELRRPLGDPAHRKIDLGSMGGGRYLSPAPLAPGRWIARITVSHGTDSWAFEEELR